MNNDYITYLGIDWGEKRIGLSIGDSSTCMAGPFGVVDSLEAVLTVIGDEEIDTIVIGEPRKMRADGISPAFLAFVAELEDRSGLEVIKVDERLSSKHADSLIGDKKTKAARDAVAAMLILQSFLDNLERS